MFSTAKAIFTRQNLLVAVALLCVVASATTAFRNTGLLMLRNSILLDDDHSRDLYTSGWTSQAGLSDYHIFETLSSAVSLNSSSWNSRWALGRAALRIGDFSVATAVFRELAKKDLRNPLAYMDTITALSKNGSASELVKIYESNEPPVQTQTLSDTVAIAYLDLSRATNDRKERQYLLERAKQLRPSDIYINYVLWESAQASGFTDNGETLLFSLRNFDLNSVAPTDERLLDYTMSVIPFLLQQDIWSYEQTKSVISFLVWKHFDSTAIESTIRLLIEQHSSEPDWVFYLAELYHRRGELTLAREAYLKVIRISSSYAFAYLRLGMLAESTCETVTTMCKDLEEAQEWYVHYASLAPGDTRMIRKLSEISEIMGLPKVDAFSDTTVPLESSRKAAARLLNLPETSIVLGANVVENGEFSNWSDSAPLTWDLGVYSGAREDIGVYIGGNDVLAGDKGAVRIMALRGGETPAGALTYGEYIGKGFDIKDSKYLISIDYAADSKRDVDLFLIGEPLGPNGKVLSKVGLPDSAGEFTRISIIADGTGVERSMVPLIRNWGTGQLWIDKVELRPVTYATDMMP